jgi:TPR repeat protein
MLCIPAVRKIGATCELIFLLYVGWFLKNGYGVERNSVRALTALRKAAEKGHVVAQACIAQAIALGEGTDANPEQALKLFKKIYDSCDDAEFKKELMKRGQLVKEFLASSQKASDAPVTPTKPLEIDDLKKFCNVPRRKEDIFKLGLDIERGKVRNVGIEFAIVCFREAGREGHLDANVKVGNCYAYGIGVRQDIVNAIRWYQKSARKSHGEAMYLLASAYATGNGIERDIDEAKKYAQQSILKGYPKAKPLSQELSKIRKDKDGCYIIPENLQFVNAANQSVSTAPPQDSKSKSAETSERQLQLPSLNRKVSNPPHINDLVELGKVFLRSNDENDHLKAFNLFNLCVFRKNSDALVGLGDCYRLGKGVSSDPEKAFRAYETSASHGTPEALYKLGLCYKTGFGVQVDLSQYKNCLQKAASMGNSDAIAELQNLALDEAKLSSLNQQVSSSQQSSSEPSVQGSTSLDLDSLDPKELCERAREFESDPEGGKEIAFSMYLKAAERKYVPAYASLGYCLENGIGCAIDAKKAMTYYEEGALKGSSDAALLLGKMFYTGRHIEKDWDKAKEWFEKVTDPELRSSRVERILRHIQGKVPKTISSTAGGAKSREAFKSYYTAAQNGDADAQYMLACCYEQGTGTSINLEEALKWYCFASTTNELAKEKYEYMVKHQGPKNPFDQLQLGKKLLTKAETVPLAAYWIEKAAIIGYSEAQFMLGVIYALGNGKPQSLAYASQWFSYAAAQGHAQAMHNLACIMEDEKPEAALDLYQKAFGLGSSKSMESVTRLLENLPVETKDIKCLEWHRKCCLMDHSSMHRGLEEYEKKLGFPSVEGLSDFEMYNTGYAYESDESINDGKLAAHYYLHGSLNNNSRCLFRLGCFYETGNGVNVDLDLAFLLLRRAADLNEVEALLKVGKWLEEGKGTKMDLEKAFKCYEKAYSYGNVFGAYYLGLCYEFGIGTANDIKKAILFYLEAVNGTCYPAQIILEERYSFVFQPDFNIDNFENPSPTDYLSKISKMDLIWSVGEESDLDPSPLPSPVRFKVNEVVHSQESSTNDSAEEAEYPVEENTQKNEEAEIASEAEPAKQPSTVEQSRIDSTIQSEFPSRKLSEKTNQREEQSSRPVPVTKEIPKSQENPEQPVTEPDSIESLTEKARNNDLEAAYSLGVKFINGDGVTQNFELGIRWLNTASVGGLAKAKYEIGLMYEKGLGVSQNFEKAFKWFLAAAREGIVEAMFKVGRAYDYGTGIAKNHGEAVEWYVKASDRGHLAALNNLACCYEYGTGVDKNVVKAAECYEKAAMKGYPQSIFCTAWCYEQGIGVNVDLKTAVAWYKKAANQKENKAIATKSALKLKQLPQD